MGPSELGERLMAMVRAGIDRIGRSTLAIVLAMLLAAGMTVRASGTAAADATGQITGRVSDPAGRGIPDVWVSAYVHDETDGSWEAVSNGNTDRNGLYTLSGLPAGTYVVGFAPSDQTYFVGEGYDDATTFDAATPVPVGAGATTEGIDVELSVGGRVTGTVTGAAADPLDRIRVNLFRESTDGWKLVDYTGTASSGRYTFAGLPVGTYRLQFVDSADADYPGTGEGYLTEYYDDATTLEKSTDVEVVAGATTGGRDARLALGGRVTGTVTGSDGTPLDRVRVTAYDLVEGEGWWLRTSITYTDASGAYTLVGLPTGTVQVGFSGPSGSGLVPEYYDDATSLARATPVAVTAGTTTPGKNARLAVGGRITGTVSGTGHPALAGVQVSAYRDDGDGWEKVGYAFSGGSGGYVLDDLPAGSYRLEFADHVNGFGYHREYYDDAGTLTTADDVVVTPGATVSGTDVQLSPTGWVTNIVPPTITGKAQVGVTLRADPGAWHAGDPTSYRWLVGGVPAARATGSTYTPVVADVGKRVQVEVTASRTGHHPAVATSAPTAAVITPKIVQVRKPRLTGRAGLGRTLSVFSGTWMPAGTTTTIRWYAGKRAIAKATSSMLRLVGPLGLKVAGKKVTARVTVSYPGARPVKVRLEAPGRVKVPKGLG